MPRRLLVLVVALAAPLVGGCDMIGGALGIESPEKVAAARDADGRAIGAACRHAGRAIEDCYALNRKAERAAMFAGWRDMNDYMRENKIDAVAPQLATQLARVAPARAAADDTAEKAAPKPADAAKPHHDPAKAHDS